MFVHQAGTPAPQAPINGRNCGPELIAAVREGRRHDIERLLHQSPASVQYQDNHLNTALHHAILEGRSYGTIKLLLGSNANPGVRNADGDTCMHLAFARRPVLGQLPILLLAGTWNEEGLGLGAIELENRRGKTAIDEARDCRGQVFPGYMEAVMMTEARLRERKRALTGQLRQAIRTDDPCAARAAMARLHWPFDLPVGENGDVPLMEAVRLGADRVAACLIGAAKEAGVATRVLNRKDRSGESTPLAWAVRAGREELVEALLINGAAPNVVVVDGYTALHIAVQEKHAKIVQLLLNYGADPNVHASSERNTPLILATKGALTDIAQQLLDHGARTDAKDTHGCDATVYAAQGGHIKLAFKLSRAQQLDVEDPAAASQDERKPRGFRHPPRRAAFLACCAIV
ncbi:ankyrin repeat domain-containing protein [Cupriavidus sp. AU9028]|uniref:ankyrin repeat domain-containing protein n=1 Tax=Cupriavidus sp. AU9028 TaxID=2871157 RepID=UPI001C94D0C7|nr:ankyrin repeat domain-containing protein [Cupriavidus sp. AU9028]MBY4898920.1 ankyrin repeat domain-containing protein [Cupriavidus sp. AU9028]